MNSFNDLPKELYNKLHRLSLDAAIEQGLITALGDNGKFIFEFDDEPGVYYGIVQDCKVQCSEKLIQEYSIEQIENEILGQLTFFTYESNGQEHIRLARPHYLDLGDSILDLNPDNPVRQKNNSFIFYSAGAN